MPIYDIIPNFHLRLAVLSSTEKKKPFHIHIVKLLDTLLQVLRTIYVCAHEINLLGTWKSDIFRFSCKMSTA